MYIKWRVNLLYRTSMKTIFTLLVSVFFFPAFPAAEPIRIGVITDLSGVAKDFGRQTQIGVTLALQDMKNEGRDVEIIIEDSRFSTKEALAAANKLLLADKVRAFYVDFTPLAAAVSPLLEARKKVMLYGAAVNSLLSNKYAFRTYSDYERGCELLAELLKSRGIVNPAMLKAEFEYAELCSAGARKVYPGLLEKSYRRGEPVLTEIASLKQKKVGAVINASFMDDTVNMLKAMRSNSLHVPVATSEESFSPEMIKEFSVLIEGSVTFGMGIDREFFRRRIEAAGVSNPPSAYEGTALAWGHLRQLAAALTQCPDSNDTECPVRELQKAGETRELGFIRWDNRSARYAYRLGTFSKGEWRETGRKD